HCRRLTYLRQLATVRLMKAETFGQRLKRLRRAAGLSQAQLALAAGLPAGTVRGWGYDRREPHFEAAAQPAAGLGVSLDVLDGIGRRGNRKGRKGIDPWTISD